jgi:hypothetical protein
MEYQLGDNETEMPQEVLVCFLKDDRGMVRACLGGIGDPSDAYAREVENDLAHEALAERASYCVPRETGTMSTERAVGARLARLINSLDTEITTHVTSGAIVDEIDSFKCEMIRRLKAGGWHVRINRAGTRYIVKRAAK